MEDTTRRQIDWVIIIAIAAALIVWGIGASQRRDVLVEKLTRGTPEQQLEATRQLVAGRMLADALKDQPRWVQDSAVRSIAELGTPQAWHELLTAFTLLDQPVKDRATALLIDAGNSAIPTLVEALKDKDAATRAGVNAVLIGIGEPAIPYLLPLMDAWDDYVRAGVNAILGGIGEPALDELIAVLKKTGPDAEQQAQYESEAADAFLRERATAQAAIKRVKAGAFGVIVSDLLTDADPDIRGLGTSLLGQIADQTVSGALKPEDAVGAVAPLLGRVTQDTSYAVRRKAATALGLLGELAVANGAVAPLVARLNDKTEHADVRAEVAEALGRLADPAAAQPLVNALVTNRNGISDQVVDGLIRIGPKAVPALASAVAQTSGETQLLVTRALAGIGGDAPIPHLASTLASPSTEVRQTAAEALRARTAPMLTKHAAATVAPLSRALNDENWRVYNAARDALAKSGPTAVPALITALSSSNVRVADLAKTALVGIGAPAVDGLLAALQKAEAAPAVARWAAIALGEMGTKAMDRVGPLVTNTGLSPRVRAAAASALGLTGEPAALKLLSQAYTDATPEVGAAVVNAAARIPSAEGIPLALKGLRSPSPVIREAAMGALSGWRVGDPRPELAKLLPAADADLKARAAVAIVMQADAQTRSSSSEVGAVREAEVDQSIRGNVGQLLTEAAGNRSLSSSVRDAAVVALGRLGYAEAIPALKSLIEGRTEHASAAAQAVARIGMLAAADADEDAKQELGEAGTVLLQLLTAPAASDAIHLEAAVALAMMNGAGASELIEMVRDTGTTDQVKVWATATLGAIGRHAANEVIEQRRISTETDFRAWMAMAMACMQEDAKAQQTFSGLTDEERPPAEKLAEVQRLADRIRLARK